MGNYDTILILDRNAESEMFEGLLSGDKRVSNAPDPRILPTTKDYNPVTQGFFGKGQDPGAQFSLGPTIKSQLEGQLGRNFSVDVFDFGTDVAVEVKYSNPKTGITSSANFLIKYNTKEGKGIVKSSAVRWRTIASHSEAMGYIKARSNSLVSKTSSAS